MPFRLYSAIGFDTLHVLDLRLISAMSDAMHPVDCQLFGMAKSRYIGLMNCRFLNLPRTNRLPNLRHFIEV